MNIKLRKDIYMKYNGCCAYCGGNIQYKDMQIDHIIPKSNFTAFTLNKYKIPVFLSHLGVNDTHHFDNLNPACRYCNKHKDAFDLESFRKEIEIQIDRLNKYSANYRIAKRYNLINETPKNVKFYFETI